MTKTSKRILAAALALLIMLTLIPAYMIITEAYNMGDENYATVSVSSNDVNNGYLSAAKLYGSSDDKVIVSNQLSSSSKIAKGDPFLETRVPYTIDKIDYINNTITLSFKIQSATEVVLATSDVQGTDTSLTDSSYYQKSQMYKQLIMSSYAFEGTKDNMSSIIRPYSTVSDKTYSASNSIMGSISCFYKSYSNGVVSDKISCNSNWGLDDSSNKYFGAVLLTGLPSDSSQVGNVYADIANVGSLRFPGYDGHTRKLWVKDSEKWVGYDEYTYGSGLIRYWSGFLAERSGFTASDEYPNMYYYFNPDNYNDATGQQPSLADKEVYLGLISDGDDSYHWAAAHSLGKSCTDRDQGFTVTVPANLHPTTSSEPILDFYVDLNYLATTRGYHYGSNKQGDARFSGLVKGSFNIRVEQGDTLLNYSSKESYRNANNETQKIEYTTNSTTGEVETITFYGVTEAAAFDKWTGSSTYDTWYADPKLSTSISGRQTQMRLIYKVEYSPGTNTSDITVVPLVKEVPQTDSGGNQNSYYEYLYGYNDWTAHGGFKCLFETDSNDGTEIDLISYGRYSYKNGYGTEVEAALTSENSAITINNYIVDGAFNYRTSYYSPASTDYSSLDGSDPLGNNDTSSSLDNGGGGSSYNIAKRFKSSYGYTSRGSEITYLNYLYYTACNAWTPLYTNTDHAICWYFENVEHGSDLFDLHVNIIPSLTNHSQGAGINSDTSLGHYTIRQTLSFDIYPPVNKSNASGKVAEFNSEKIITSGETNIITSTGTNTYGVLYATYVDVYDATTNTSTLYVTLWTSANDPTSDELGLNRGYAAGLKQNARMCSYKNKESTTDSSGIVLQDLTNATTYNMVTFGSSSEDLTLHNSNVEVGLSAWSAFGVNAKFEARSAFKNQASATKMAVGLDQNNPYTHTWNGSSYDVTGEACTRRQNVLWCFENIQHNASGAFAARINVNTSFTLSQEMNANTITNMYNFAGLLALEVYPKTITATLTEKTSDGTSVNETTKKTTTTVVRPSSVSDAYVCYLGNHPYGTGIAINGGKVSTDNMNFYDSSVSDSDKVGASKNGFLFKGWQTNCDCTLIDSTSGNKITHVATWNDLVPWNNEKDSNKVKLFTTDSTNDTLLIDVSSSCSNVSISGVYEKDTTLDLSTGKKIIYSITDKDGNIKYDAYEKWYNKDGSGYTLKSMGQETEQVKNSENEIDYVETTVSLPDGVTLESGDRITYEVIVPTAIVNGTANIAINDVLPDNTTFGIVSDGKITYDVTTRSRLKEPCTVWPYGLEIGYIPFTGESGTFRDIDPEPYCTDPGDPYRGSDTYDIFYELAAYGYEDGLLSIVNNGYACCIRNPGTRSNGKPMNELQPVVKTSTTYGDFVYGDLYNAETNPTGDITNIWYERENTFFWGKIRKGAEYRYYLASKYNDYIYFVKANNDALYHSRWVSQDQVCSPLLMLQTGSPYCDNLESEISAGVLNSTTPAYFVEYEEKDPLTSQQVIILAKLDMTYYNNSTEYDIAVRYTVTVN